MIKHDKNVTLHSTAKTNELMYAFECFEIITYILYVLHTYLMSSKTF